MDPRQKEAIPVNMPDDAPIALGDEFTIAGIKLLPNGRFITDCKPGEETLLISSKRPSIFRLVG